MKAHRHWTCGVCNGEIQPGDNMEVREGILICGECDIRVFQQLTEDESIHELAF